METEPTSIGVGYKMMNNTKLDYKLKRVHRYEDECE